MPGKVVKSARTGDDRLLRRKPAMYRDTLRHLLSGFDVGCLHVDRTHAELFITQVALVMRCHVVFNQITVADNPAHKVGLVAPLVKITMTDLPVVIRANRVVSLT